MTVLRTETHEWIDHVCRRFSKVTGRPFRFTPADPKNAARVETRLRNDPDCCWLRQLADGPRVIGFLQLDGQQGGDVARNVFAVDDVAEIAAQFIELLSSAETSLSSRFDDLSTLLDLGLSRPEQTGPRTGLRQLLRAAVQLTRVESAAFFLLNPSTNHLNLRAVYGIAPSDVPSPCRDLAADAPDTMALSRGELVVQTDLDPNGARWLAEGTATGHCAAVYSEAGPIGTLWVFGLTGGTPLADRSRLLKLVAGQLGALLERVVLLQESADQHRLQGDLQVAAEAQNTNPFRDRPVNRGIETAGRSSGRFELGGDLCELIPLDEARTAVAVGDAAGDSIPAAMVMSAARGALHAIVTDPAQPLEQTQRVMQRLNGILDGITPAHQFMSLVFGVLDTQSNSFAYTNAGHPAPLLIRRGKGGPLESHGLLLGVTGEAQYDRSVLRLAAGDWLVFFSDGVSEAMNSRREMFGPDGILSSAQQAAGDSPQELMQTIWQRLEAHLADGGHNHPDDRTLLVLRMQGE